MSAAIGIVEIVIFLVGSILIVTRFEIPAQKQVRVIPLRKKESEQ